MEEKKLSWRYYAMIFSSVVFLLLTPFSFYWYAVDPIKDSFQGFTGALGTLLSFALSLILYLYAEERQRDIDFGLYVPPDQKRKIQENQSNKKADVTTHRLFYFRNYSI